MKGVYPGSFDPVTYGHIDIIERASKICDELVVGVLVNAAKHPMFSLSERVEMVREAVREYPNVRVESFEGLTVDFARSNGASVMIRGLRSVSDLDYELQLAQTNRAIAPEIDTVLLTTNLEYSFISSSIVKEIAGYGGSIEKFVTPAVLDRIRQKLTETEK